MIIKVFDHTPDNQYFPKFFMAKIHNRLLQILNRNFRSVICRVAYLQNIGCDTDIILQHFCKFFGGDIWIGQHLPGFQYGFLEWRQRCNILFNIL